MAAPDLIEQLVSRFEDNRAMVRSSNYNEALLRLEFLDPFFTALSWGVNNEQGYAEAYKDGFVEDTLEVEGAAKAPDYAFRIGGTRKFFVEAKKPAVKIEVTLVERILSLHKQSARLSRGTLRSTPQEKEMLRGGIEATDQAIDALVYQLYGLPEAEIKIVEGG